MSVRDVGVKAFFGSSLLAGRDIRLNEKAYQRAVGKKIQREVVFKTSQNISLDKISQEKSSREYIAKLQNEINNHTLSKPPEALVH